MYLFHVVNIILINAFRFIISLTQLFPSGKLKHTFVQTKNMKGDTSADQQKQTFNFQKQFNNVQEMSKYVPSKEHDWQQENSL